MKKFRKALSLMLVICMFFSVLAVNINAEYSVPTGNIWMSYSGADHYVRYGGTVIDKIRITANATLDGVISSTERYLLTKNTATIDSIVAEDPAGSDYAGNLCTWDLIDPEHSVYIDVLLTNVTADPILTAELKEDNQGSIIDSNHKKQNVLTNQTEMADSPVVHLVYDLDVTAGENGKVEYQAAKFMDPNVDDDYTDLIKYWKDTGLTNQQAGKMIFPGNNVLNKTETTANYTGTNAVTKENPSTTNQWVSGEELTFKVTPDDNYEVDTATSSIGTLKNNNNGTYTLTVPETAVTAASTKATVNFTFKQKGNDPEYKIQHNVRNLNDANYTVIYTEKKNAATGADVSATPITTGEFGDGTDKVDFAGVEDNGEKLTERKGKVTADGSLVLNIYYDRKEFKVTFVPNEATASVTPADKTLKYGALIEAPNPTNSDSTKSFGGWFEDTALAVPAPVNMPAKNINIYAKWTTGNDPIRAVDDPTDIKDPDPADPDGSEITNPGGYVLPGENGQDENGGGDDQVLVPNDNGTGEKPENKGDELELPGGGFIDKDGNGTKDPNDPAIPPAVVDPKGNIISYIVYVKLMNVENAASPVEIPAPANFLTKVYVPVGSGFATSAPFIDGYVFKDAIPTDLTIPESALQAATSQNNVTINYVKAKPSQGTDAIRPWEDTDEPNTDPKKGEDGDYIIPGPDGNDDKGENDDIIMKPNKDPDGKTTAEIINGRLDMPDGGTDTAGNKYPPSVIDKNGNIVAYIVYVELLDKNTNASLTPTTAFTSKTYVAVGSGFGITAPEINNYKYNSVKPALKIPESDLKKETGRVLVQLFYLPTTGQEVKTVKVVINIKGPAGMTIPTGYPMTVELKSGTDFTATAPIINGYTPDKSSQKLTKITSDKSVTFTYTKDNPGTEPTYFTLTFESNGGTPINAITLPAGSAVNLTAYVPTRVGYTFDGWYIDSALTNKVTSVTLNKNMIVYAKWTATTAPETFRDDHISYVIGYKDNMVHPEANITRGETATIFFRLLTDTARNKYWMTSNDFNDVPSVTWFNNAVSTMSNAGFINGYTDGTFRGDRPITRAEFSVIAARANGANGKYSGSNKFSDISDNWASGYINEAVDMGLITGYPDGTFKPNSYITRAEAITIVNRFLGRDKLDSTSLTSGMITWPDNKNSDVWYYYAIQEATNSHEYTRRDNGYESWTKITASPDWAALEKSWSNANSAK